MEKPPERGSSDVNANAAGPIRWKPLEDPRADLWAFRGRLILGIWAFVLIPWAIWNLPLHLYWSLGFAAVPAWMTLELDRRSVLRAHTEIWLAMVGLIAMPPALPGWRILLSIAIVLVWVTGVGLRVMLRIPNPIRDRWRWDTVAEGLVAVGLLALCRWG